MSNSTDAMTVVIADFFVGLALLLSIKPIHFIGLR
jgi:hypothetical protein